MKLAYLIVEAGKSKTCSKGWQTETLRKAVDAAVQVQRQPILFFGGNCQLIE